MNKLEEIKQEVAEFEGYLAEYAKWDNNNITMGGRNAHEDIMCATLNDETYEYLKVLLPVVEAAAKLTPEMFYDDESLCCVGCMGFAISSLGVIEFNHQPDCPVSDLFTALAALLQSEGTK